MKTTILLFLLFIPLVLPAQDNIRIIYPGTSFINRTHDTLYCLPKQKLEILMEQKEISHELNQNLKARNDESDSLLSLKTFEAQGWYIKLIEKDSLLQKTEITGARQKHRNKTKNKIWFGVGVVFGWALKTLI